MNRSKETRSHDHCRGQILTYGYYQVYLLFTKHNVTNEFEETKKNDEGDMKKMRTK